MARWSIIFHPEEGQRHSPESFLEGMKPAEVASIRLKLGIIEDLDNGQWPGWVKMVQGLYQITSGDFRIYFKIDHPSRIIVSHICRKVSQKAKQEDIDRANSNLENYFKKKK